MDIFTAHIFNYALGAWIDVDDSETSEMLAREALSESFAAYTDPTSPMRTPPENGT